MLICPAEQRICRDSRSNYVYNKRVGLFLENKWKNPWRRVSSLNKPSECLAMTDTYMDATNSLSYISPWHTVNHSTDKITNKCLAEIGTRHNNSASMLYFDGHAAMMNWNALVKVFTKITNNNFED